METNQLKEKLLNIFSDIERNKNEDALYLLDSVLKSLDTQHSYNSMSAPIELKDSIKLVKNTKGYNYEIRLVAKENVDLLSQLDFVKAELDKRIKSWEAKK